MKAVFDIECKGRDAKSNNVLGDRVQVKVEVYQPLDTDLISTRAICKYNGGSHGQKCLASTESAGICPYAADLPYAIDYVVKESFSQRTTPVSRL